MPRPPARTASLALLLAAVAALYGLTAARAALGGDSAEFATMFADGGVPHPSGYPLYVVWLRATAWMPGASPAHAASLSTAVLGVLAAFVLQRACVRWGASRGASLLAAALWAASPLPWAMATHPEVFLPNALIALAIVSAAAPDATPRGRARVVLLALLAGLGLANHLTIVFLAPLGLWAAVRALRRERAGAAAVPLALVALALGLLPYAYLYAVGRAPGDRWVWGSPGTLDGLVHHFLRSDYGTFQHAIGGERAPLAQLAELAASLARGGLFAALPLAIVGLAALVSAGGARRAGALALVASFLLAGPAFVASSNVAVGGEGLLVLQRFHLLPQALLAMPVALGIDWVRARIGRAALLDALLAVLALGQVVVFLPEIREHARPTVELWVRNTLGALPEGAVLLGTGDQRLFPMIYAERALALRPDVTYVDPLLLHYDWYRRRVARPLGFEPDAPVARSVDTVALANRVLATGRPLLLANVFSGAIPRAFELSPWGPVVRVVAPGEPPRSAAELERAQLAREARYAREPEPAERGTWGGELAEWTARGWLVLADAFRRANDPDGFTRCVARAASWAPWEVPETRGDSPAARD